VVELSGQIVTADTWPQVAQGTDARRPAARNQYDATRDTHRRKAPTGKVNAEDRVLCKAGRRKLISGLRDLRRNYADAAWAIRKHLDFVSSFTFQCRTTDTGLNSEIETFLKLRSRPENCDLAGRHPLRRFIRQLEGCRTVDGDVFALKISDGRMQAIEGDRVRDPRDRRDPNETWVHGIKVSAAGRALAYAIHKRNNLGLFELDKILSARFVMPHGYYDRFDQVRGVTPLSTALNAFRDLYESRTYALAKAKVAQLFGLVIYSDAADSVGPVIERETTDGEDEEKGYEVDFDKGPVMLQLDGQDRASFLENKTPSSEFREFDQVILASALKSLDIPFSFYNESFTNFFGSKGALQQYLFSARQKREDNKDFLDNWTAWQIGMAVAAGDIRLPGRMEFTDLAWSWIHVGLPWWKPLEEVKAYREGIAGGLTNTPRACRERGEDAWEILDEEAEYQIYRAEVARRVREDGGRLPGQEPDGREGTYEDGPINRALSREREGETANV
jgi:capsid protein